MSDLPRKAQDRVNTFGVVLIGVVAAVLLWVSVVALQAYYYNTAGELETERSAAGNSREVRDLKANQQAYLQEGKYVDPQKGIVTVPIEDAMRLVLRDAKAGAPSLVPVVGAHDQATVPAVSGRPPDTAAAPGGAAPAGAAPGAAAPGGAGAAAGSAGAAPTAGSAPTPAPDASGAPAAPVPDKPPTTPAGPGTGSQPEAGTSPPATPTPPSPSPNP